MTDPSPRHLRATQPAVRRSPAPGVGALRAWLARRFADPHAWLALLLAVPAMAPLFAPGYFFAAHDAHHSVYFLVEFDRTLREGAIWPVWAPDAAVGFGYPLWLVYAPLSYFAAEAFHLAGLGFTAAVKATWVLGFVLGALGTYRLVRRWWGPKAGLIASLALTYAPYHLVQIYVRAALAEFMALAWLPWALLALAALWDRPGPRRAAGAALAIGVLVLTHTVSTLIFAPLLAGFVAVFLIRSLRAARKGQGRAAVLVGRPLLWTAVAGGLGLLLASVFLLPLAAERQFIVEAQWVRDTYDYRQHFIHPAQFFDPAWGFGYSVAGPNDDMSFQLGPVIVLASAIGALAAWAGRRAPGRSKALFLTLASATALALMLAPAAPLWDAMPLVSLVQFPWRLLAVTTFTLALLAGFATRRLGRAAAHPHPYVLAIALVLASLPYVQAELAPIRPEDEQPRAVIDFELAYPDMRGMTQWSERVPLDADSPLIAQYLAGEPLRRAAVASGPAQIVRQEANALSASARVSAEGPARLRFYTYYFPGWRATVDGHPVAIEPEPPNGLISVAVPVGDHEVSVRFGATPVRTLASILSLAGLAAVVALLLLARIWQNESPRGIQHPV